MATPLVKQKPSSADMVGEKEDGAKVDPKNIVDIKYDDLPEEQCQALEVQLKEIKLNPRGG